MRAVRVSEHGGLDRLQLVDIPRPQPRADQVLVRIRAMALNHLDVWVRRGVPGHKFPLPLTLGCDGAGVVEEAGAAVENVKPGDEVVVLPGTSCGHCEACLSGADHLCRRYAILGEHRDGTCAEFVVVPSVNVAPRPAVFSWHEAAAYPLGFLTAWNALVRRAQLRPGETVLIHAAGSGVGSAGVQISKRVVGAEVIALVRGATKVQAAQALGADRVIDTTAGSFAKAVRDATGGRGVEVVFEHPGAATFNESVKCLAWGGRLVTCGATSGAEVAINLNQLFFKSLSFLGATMGSKADVLHLLRLAGRLRPVIDRVLRLDQVREAQQLLEERKVFGKVVLEP